MCDCVWVSFGGTQPIERCLLSDQVKSSRALKGKPIVFQTVLFPSEAEAFEKVLGGQGALTAKVMTEGLPAHVKEGHASNVFSGWLI